MKLFKFFYILLSFFYFSPLALSALDIEVVDYEKLIRLHPISQRFDHETGRFIDTDSEIKDVNYLRNEILSLNEKIAGVEQKKAELVAASLLNGYDDSHEEKVWKSIELLDDQIKELNARKQSLTDLFHADGQPPISTVIEIIRKIRNDVEQELRSQHSGAIILNRLPEFNLAKPRINQKEDGLLNYFYTGNKASARNYIMQSYSIGRLFPSTLEPVIYLRPGDKND